MVSRCSTTVKNSRSIFGRWKTFEQALFSCDFVDPFLQRNKTGSTKSYEIMPTFIPRVAAAVRRLRNLPQTCGHTAPTIPLRARVLETAQPDQRGVVCALDRRSLHPSNSKCLDTPAVKAKE